CQCAPVFVGCVAKTAPARACPAIGCVEPPACSCHGLDESSCSARPSCTTNYCVGCDGAQRFSGCTGPGEAPPVCNDHCGCHGNSDCNGELCVVPGGSAGCGACQFPQSCTKDTECNAGYICDYVPCSCGGNKNDKGCVPSCASTGCAEGQTCG